MLISFKSMTVSVVGRADIVIVTPNYCNEYPIGVFSWSDDWE